MNPACCPKVTNDDLAYLENIVKNAYSDSSAGFGLDTWRYGYCHAVTALVAEVRRLKRGDFTEDEFQNLCHHFSEDDACRFRQGCEEYQKKLFGSKQPDQLASPTNSASQLPTSSPPYA